MPTYRDSAVVLRAYKLGEADRIITFLTRRNGKVRAVAKGVRRTSSRFGGRLEPFNHVDIQFAKGKNLDVVAQVETLHPFGDLLRCDYPKFTVGEVMLETADRLVSEEGTPALQQYLLLVGALRVLGEGTTDGPRPATMILDSYLLRSLAVSGYAPELGACARCGSTSGVAWFAPAAGGRVCDACHPSGAVRPSPGAWRLLGDLLAGTWTDTRDVPTQLQREVSGITAAFVAWQLEHGLRSLPLVDRTS